MGISVGVENVADRELADGQHEAIRRLRAAELIDVVFQLLGRAAEPDGLPDEGAVHPGVGVGVAKFVGFAAGKSGQTERVAQPKTLVDFRVEPEFRALPQPQAEI